MQAPLNLPRGGVSVYTASTFVSKFAQIVCLKLYTIQFIVTTQFLDFFASVLFWKLVLSVFIGGKLLIQHILRESLTPLLLGAKLRWNGEEWHDRIRLKVVGLYLIEYLQCIFQCLWDVGEDVIHLLLRLKPLLFGVEHAVRVIEVFACAQT